MDPELLSHAALVLVPMILSLSVHEFAHAFSAKWLGDDTAERAGRLTLNPVAHIDVLGTLILPALLVLSGSSMFFGWAKPVPVDVGRFNGRVSRRVGRMLTAGAGPLANVILAVLAQGVLAAMVHVAFDPGPAMTDFLRQMLTLNVVLAVFNLLPVYPLDGQKVLGGLLPLSAAVPFERFSVRYGSWILLALILFGGSLIFRPVVWILHGLAAAFGVA